MSLYIGLYFGPLRWVYFSSLYKWRNRLTWLELTQSGGDGFSYFILKVLMCYYYLKNYHKLVIKKKSNQYRHDVSDPQPASPTLPYIYCPLSGTHQGCYCLWAFALSRLSTWNDFFFGFLVAGSSYHLGLSSVVTSSKKPCQAMQCEITHPTLSVHFYPSYHPIFFSA